MLEFDEISREIHGFYEFGEKISLVKIGEWLAWTDDGEACLQDSLAW